MAINKKMQVGGNVVTPKAKSKAKPASKPAYQTPADFYPESYDKKFPRTPGGGDMYPQTIKREEKLKKKGMMKMGGTLKTPAADQKGLKKLPTPVRNKMGFKKNGGTMSKKK
jgi:hypothetical protein